MENAFLECRLRGVFMENDEPIVILEERRSNRRILVHVGPFEASAIILELEGIASPRPLTHDLLAQFFKEGGFSLDRVELLGESADDPRARLSYRKGLYSYEKEVRPSDALALAIRLSSPIFASSAMLGDWKLAAHRPKVLDFEDWKGARMRA